MRTGRRRKGFALPAALAIIIIFSIMAGSRLFFSRQQLNVASRLADHEKAYQVCVSGLTAARSLLEEAVSFINDQDPLTFPKRDRAPASIREVVRRLTGEDGNFVLEGTEFELDCPATRYIAKNFRGVHSIAVSVRFDRGKPIYMEGPRLREFEISNRRADTGHTFVKVDSKESNYTLTLRVEARAGASKCSAGSFTECRLVNVLPPVIGKFGLYLRTLQGLKINAIEDAENASDFKIFPVMLDNGATVREDDKMAPEAMRDLVDSQGWIYLGGGSRWKFPMTFAGGNAAASDGPVNDAFHYYPIESGRPLAATSSLKYYACCTQLHPGLGEPSCEEALKMARRDDYSFTSALNLFGSSGSLSPTLVVGNVARSYALLQGIYNSSSHRYAPLPYLDEAAFASSSWPGEISPSTADTLRDNFSNDYSKYKSRMCDIVDESYNLANLLLVDHGMAGFDRIAVFDPDEFARAFPAFPALRRVSSDGFPAAFYRPVGAGRLTISDDRGKLLFHGDDPGRLYEKGLLAHKAGYVYESQKEFFKRHGGAGRVLRISGVVLVKGGLDLQEKFSVPRGGGGVVIAEGDIRIRAGLAAAESEPVSLVSSRGAIRLETGEKIDAALVAMTSKVQLPHSFDVKGLVAAREIALAPGTQGARRRISYNPAFDPTCRANYLSAYRMMVKGGWQNFVE